jgi:DNA-directed RNA polymerase specialized sigma24 family protein
MLNRLRKKYTYEDLFLERYDQLLAWAIRLTDHDLQQAEDLVHDVFVKFAMTQPDLHRIENTDAYLYTALRNTYRSQVRRAGYGSIKHLELLDFDSAELWLRRLEHRQAFQTQEELHLICRYSCLRKETAKAASVLILRYFLGYFPSEIARILICERQSIAELLRVARVEARLFVDDPKRLSFVDRDLDLEPVKVRGALPTEELLAMLRHRIFSSCSGKCLSGELWRERYLNGTGQAIDRRTLAHLVSCPHCLDEVNRTLGMPPLEDRNPTDSTGHDPGSKGGAGGGENGSLKRIRRRAEQVYNHDPKELRIVVDGRLLGSQEINAEVNKQTLSLNETEPDTFIEIYSEQDIRLTYLIVEQLPIGVFEQREVVELSDGRRIEISLNFKGTYPELQVVHYESSLQPTDVPPLPQPIEDETIVGPEPESRLSLLLNRFSQWLSRLAFRPRIAVAAGMILIAAWLIFSLPGKPTADDLMNRSAIAEASLRETIAAKPDQVFHRTIEIEEKRSDNSVVARRRVEIWQNSGKRLEVRRLYDENSRLIASEWKTTNGDKIEGRKLYRRASKSQVENPSEIESKNLWRLDLSAKEFVAFAGNPGGGIVEEAPGAYVVSYQNPSAGLARASLTIDRRSNRAIGQQFIFRYTNEDRVVLFNEKNFERRPLDATLEPVFEVEPELSESSAQLGNTVTPSQPSPVAPGASVPSSAAPVVATTALEVKALALLHRIGADLGEEVSLTRSSNGKLQIEAIVETPQRKDEILASLAPIAGHPGTMIRVETVAEAMRGRTGKKKPSTQPMIQEYDATARAIPAEPELRAFFTSRIAGRRPLDNSEEETIDAEIRKFTIDILRRSERALLFAYALKRLADSFSNEDLRTLDAESRAAWLSMIASHAQRLSVDAAKMRAALQPIIAGSPDAGGNNATSGQIESKDDADLSAAIRRLFEWETAVDRDIRSAFIASSQATTTPSVKTVQLWRDLLKVEKLSIEIHQKSSTNNRR